MCSLGICVTCSGNCERANESKQRTVGEENEKKNKMFKHKEHDDVNINDSAAVLIGIWPCTVFFPCLPSSSRNQVKNW